MAHAVLPMEGRAAMMMSSESCRPLVMRVEVDVVGGEAGDLAALLVELVDGAEGLGDDLADAGEAALDGGVGDVGELGFDVR